jgi:hypothetical protein
VPASDIASLVSHWNRENPASSFTNMPRAVV